MLEATCEYIINEKEIKKYEQIYDDTKDIKTDLINNLIGINNIFGVDCPEGMSRDARTINPA